MVLAGVSFGGYNAFRGWGRSSYFEFEIQIRRRDGGPALGLIPSYFTASRKKLITLPSAAKPAPSASATVAPL